MKSEMYEQYVKAMKLGQKCYKDSVLRGRYPYLQVLDEILDDSMIVGRVDIGLVDIPAEQITGTKTAGRRTAFAANFMPLLSPDSEFAYKWMNLCAAHLGDEGIRDPIRCFEYLGRFYVQEGNKRVSVLKSYNAPTVPGYVTRIVPVWSSDPAIQIYYEFMRSYELTGLYRIHFTRLGSFAKLQAALGYEPDHVWTPDERQRFLAGFTYFQEAFKKLGGESLPITTADALLVWLRVYTFDALKTTPAAELVKALNKVWPDVRILAQAEPIAMETEVKKPEKGFISRILQSVFPSLLTVAFIQESTPEESDWASAHDLGRQYLEAVMGEKVDTLVRAGVGAGEGADQAMEEVVQAGAQVIFATTAPLIGACRKLAAKYPNIRILNCSAGMPYTGVRTYYSRIYEGKFITGAIAGAMSRDGRIGYVASNPILGVPASINAFALGARLTNPQARLLVRWSCVEGDPMVGFIRDGLEWISNRDIPTPDRIQEPWGLCQVGADGTLRSQASPYWHWGHVYVKLVKSILDGSWDTLGANGNQAVNYWWGINSQAVGVLLAQELPEGICQLVQILQRAIADGSLDPFRRHLIDQEGNVRSDGEKWFSPEEILHMHWLCDNVEGTLPTYDTLLPMSRSLVRLLGIYRDSIPPEKETCQL